MVSKIVVVAAAAAGYVLGTRAGREQYQQIKTQAERLWRDPRVQDKTSQVAEVAKAKAAEGKDKLSDAGKHAAGKVRSGRTQEGAPPSGTPLPGATE